MAVIKEEKVFEESKGAAGVGAGKAATEAVTGKSNIDTGSAKSLNELIATPDAHAKRVEDILDNYSGPASDARHFTDTEFVDKQNVQHTEDPKKYKLLEGGEDAPIRDWNHGGVTHLKTEDGKVTPISELDTSKDHYGLISYDGANSLTHEDSGIFHVQGADQYSNHDNSVKDYQILEMYNLNDPKLMSDKRMQDVSDEALRGLKTAKAAQAGVELKMRTPNVLYKSMADDAERFNQDEKWDIDSSHKVNPKKLKGAIWHNEPITMKKLLLEDGMHPNYIHEATKRFTDASLDDNHSMEPRDLEKEFGISNKASHPFATTLGVVADDASTFFPQEVRNWAKNMLEDLPDAKYILDYVPAYGAGRGNSIYHRQLNLFPELVEKVTQLKKAKTADEQSQLRRTIYSDLLKAHNAIFQHASDIAVLEPEAQAILHKTSPTLHKTMFHDLPDGEFPVVEQTKGYNSMWDAAKESLRDGVDVKGERITYSDDIIKPDVSRQQIGRLPASYAQTEQGEVAPPLQHLLKETRLIANDEAMDAYDEFRSNPQLLKDAKELSYNLVRSLDALWAESTPQAKRISVVSGHEPKAQDIVHNTVIGYQNTAFIGNILHDNLRRDLSRSVYETGIPKGKAGDKFLKQRLMPAISTPENVNFLKEMKRRYEIQPHADSIYFDKHIDDLADKNINLPEFQHTLEHLQRPTDKLYDSEGRPILTKANLVHLKVHEYDRTIEKLKAMPIIRKAIDMHNAGDDLGDLWGVLGGRLDAGMDADRVVGDLWIQKNRVDSVGDGVKKLIVAVKNDPQIAADLQRLDEISKRVDPKLKATTLFGTHGSQIDMIANNCEAIAGNVFEDGFKPMWRSGDLVSMILNDGKLVRKGTGMPAGKVYSPEDVIGAFGALKERHPDVDPSRLHDLVVGSILNSEWAKLNKLTTAEDIGFISKVAVNNGHNVAKVASAMIYPDIRIPSLVLEKLGLASENKGTGYAGLTSATALFPAEVKGAANGANNTLIHNQLDPKSWGLDVRKTNILRTADSDDINTHALWVGGPQAMLLKYPQGWSVNSMAQFIDRMPQHSMYDRLIHTGNFDRMYDGELTPQAGTAASKLRYQQEQLLSMMDGSYNPVHPSDIPAGVNDRVVVEKPDSIKDEQDKFDTSRYNAYNEKINEYQFGDKAGEPIRVLKNMDLSLQSVMDKGTKLIKVEELKADGHNSMVNFGALMKSLDIDPSERARLYKEGKLEATLKDLAIQTAREIATASDQVYHMSQNLRMQISKFIKDSGDAIHTKQGELSDIVERVQRGYQSSPLLRDIIDSCRTIFNAKGEPILPAEVNNMRMFMNHTVTSPAFMVKEIYNDPEALLRKSLQIEKRIIENEGDLRHAGQMLSGDIVKAGRGGNYSTTGRVEIPNSIRMLINGGHDLEHGENGIGYKPAMRIMKPYIRALSKELREAGDASAVSRINYALRHPESPDPQIYEIMKDLASTLNVKTRWYRGPKLLSPSPESYKPKFYDNIDGKTTGYYAGGQTEHISIRPETLYNANADFDGDEGNVTTEKVLGVKKKIGDIVNRVKDLGLTAPDQDTLAAEDVEIGPFLGSVIPNKVVMDNARVVSQMGWRALSEPGNSNIIDDPITQAAIDTLNRLRDRNSIPKRVSDEDMQRGWFGNNRDFQGLTYEKKHFDYTFGKLPPEDTEEVLNVYRNDGGIRVMDDLRSMIGIKHYMDSPLFTQDVQAMSANENHSFTMDAAYPKKIKAVDRGTDGYSGYTLAQDIVNCIGRRGDVRGTPSRFTSVLNDRMIQGMAHSAITDADEATASVMKTVTDKYKEFYNFAKGNTKHITDNASVRAPGETRKVRRKEASNKIDDACRQYARIQTTDYINSDILPRALGGFGDIAIPGPFKRINTSAWTGSAKVEDLLIPLDTSNGYNYGFNLGLTVVNLEKIRSAEDAVRTAQLMLNGFSRAGLTPASLKDKPVRITFATRHFEPGQDERAMALIGRAIANNGYSVVGSQGLPPERESSGSGIPLGEAVKTAWKAHAKHHQRAIAAHDEGTPSELIQAYDNKSSAKKRVMRRWNKEDTTPTGLAELHSGSYGSQEQNRLLVHPQSATKLNIPNKVAKPAETNNQIAFTTGAF